MWFVGTKTMFKYLLRTMIQLSRFMSQILIVGLLLISSSCGSNDSSATLPPPIVEQSDSSARSLDSSTSLKDIFLDSSIEITLLPRTPIGDPNPIPAFSYDDHVIAWTERRSGDIVTTSRVNDPDGAMLP